MRHSINAVKSWLGGGVARWVDYEKELLSAIVSYVSEERERKLRFQNTCKRARRAIGAYFDNTRHRPFAPIDPVPGQRIAFDRDWREAMAGPERQVQALLRNLI
jgi:hypothetical protein